MNDDIKTIKSEILSDENLKTICEKLADNDINNNIGILYLQKQNNDICRECKGNKECALDTYEMQSYLVLQGKNLTMKYHQCQFVDESSSNDIEKMFFPSNIELGKLEINENRAEVLSKISKIINLPNNSKGIYLYGKFGTGKTFLLLKCAEVLAKKGLKVIVAYYPDLTRQIKNSFNDHTTESIILKLKQADVLILDDIGGEMNSAFIRDEFLSPILQFRMFEKKLTFMTSNYDITLLRSHFMETKDNVNASKCDRVIERIRSMMDIIELKDKNYRI